MLPAAASAQLPGPDASAGLQSMGSWSWNFLMPPPVTYPVPAAVTSIALTSPLSTVAEAVAPDPLPTESVMVTVGAPV